MNTLRRKQKRADGIYGEFTFAEDTAPSMVTLEHSYEQADGSWDAKVPVGVYQCVRGNHRLHGMDHDFSTFEITGVAGHSGILFHRGNFNKDSEGCVLCGERVITQANGEEMITATPHAFEEFMKRLEGIDSFTLEVV
jgi:hypothetical protein